MDCCTALCTEAFNVASESEGNSLALSTSFHIIYTVFCPPSIDVVNLASNTISNDKFGLHVDDADLNKKAGPASGHR